MSTVLLFDIDGTLVATGGAGRRAMVGAFVELYSNERVFDGMSFAGMTDRAMQVVLIGCAAFGALLVLGAKKNLASGGRGGSHGATV